MQNLYYYPYPVYYPAFISVDSFPHSLTTSAATFSSYPYARILPQINPNTFMNSARQSKDLLRDAQTVSEGVYKSHSFSKQLMEAAQQSNTELVKNLIASLAIQNHSEIAYNPDGIRITITPKNQTNNCCTVILSLKWQDFI
ncbi:MULTISPECIES: hypothetical protein [Bacillus]|uniref:hypothetical protein n=1 Tax=Bacillus TaxID=1386 RepID=UPI0002F24BEE|nr:MULTISPECIES: hypothetical protein [Bacillus]